MRNWIVLSVLAVMAVTAVALLSQNVTKGGPHVAALRPDDAISALALAAPTSGLPSSPFEQADHICDLFIPVDQTTLDGSDGSIQPGTTLCLTGGSRPPLRVTALRGTEDQPIVIMDSGPVTIRGDQDDYAGINVTNSQHLRISGSGSEGVRCGARHPVTEQRCGISIYGTGRGIAGTEGTTGLVIDHVEISGTTHSGIFVRSKIEEGFGRTDFIQRDTIVAHVYLHDVGREGLYLGSSSYDAGDDPVLDGVTVEQNLVVNTGWDGIQVGSAVADCSIAGNIVVLSGTEDRDDQNSGIIANRGSSCDISRNIVVSAGGVGVYVQGNGGHAVNDNLVVGAGVGKVSGNDGIVVRTGSNPGNAVQVVHNTVVAPARHGVRLLVDTGSDHILANNLVVAAPGDPFEWNSRVTHSGNRAFGHLDVLAEPVAGDFRPVSTDVLLDSPDPRFTSPDLLGVETPAEGRRTAGAIEKQSST